MRHRCRSSVRRLLVSVVAVAAVVAGSLALPASAQVTAVWQGLGAFRALNVVHNGTTFAGVPSGVMRLRINGVEYSAYCIEFVNGNLNTVDEYQEADWTATTASTDEPRVNWILRNSYPNRSTAALGALIGQAITADEAAAATQAAIWRFTEPSFSLVRPDPANSAAVLALYDYLTGPANVGDPAEPPASLTVTPASASGEAGALIGPFTVTASAASMSVSAAAPATAVNAVGDPITSVPSGGQFFVRVPAGTAPGSVSVTVSGTVTVGTGRVFITPTREPPLQKQILAEAATAPVSETVTVRWTAATVTTTTTAATTTTIATTTTAAPTTSIATTTTAAATTTTPTVLETTVVPSSVLPTSVAQTTIPGTLPVTGSDNARPLLLVVFGLLVAGASLVAVQMAAVTVQRRRRR